MIKNKIDNKSSNNYDYFAYYVQLARVLLDEIPYL